MKKSFVLAAAVLILWGCAPATVCNRGGIEYEGACVRTESLLAECSRKVTVHFIRNNKAVPKDFNGEQFLHILETEHPARYPVNALRTDFKIMARPLDKGFSVMFCTQDGSSKLFEDFNCTFEKVDLVRWDKKAPYPCEFEQHPERYCKVAESEKR